MTNKKLRSGMTLLEVVVAMSVFSLMTLGITMAFAACIKYNARNVRRDFELNTQQTALEKGNEGGVLVYNDTFNNRQTIEFTSPGGSSVQTDLGWSVATGVYEGLTQYRAQQTAFNQNDINFDLKTFSSANLGSSRTVGNPDEDLYVLKFNNLNSNDIDVRIEMNPGTIAYLGNYHNDGYTNNSPMYTVSLPGYNPENVLPVYEVDDDGNARLDSDGNQIISSSLPSSMAVGLKLSENPADPSTIPYVHVKIITGGAITFEFDLYRYNFSSTDGVAEFNYNDLGQVRSIS